MIALAGCRHASQESPPDLLLVNGTVITVDANDRIAGAIAIRGDRIVAVGTTVAIEALAGPRTRRIDLAGRTVLQATGIDTGNRGYPNIEPDTLGEMIRMYHDAGYPEASATFMWWIGDTYAGNFGSRARRLDPFATYQKRGIRWANGSDYSVTPFAARYGLWAAVAHESVLGIYGGDPFGRDEVVDIHAALRAVTIWVAHQMFLDKKIGSIEVGKYADLAVWDRNPYRVPTADLKDMKCQMPVFDGKIVFQAEQPVAS